MKLDILKTIQKYEFIYFVQLGQGSVNLTFQEKEIFIWSFVKNENKKERKIGKYQFTMYNLS
jgi:hypothetical protein